MAQQTIAPPVVRGQWFPMSYEEFQTWAPERAHAEWFDGEGIIFVAPTMDHQDGALFLAKVLGTYVDVFGVGKVLIAPFEVKLREGARPEPDVLFVAAEHADRWGDGKRLLGPPDFVAEFLSDDTASHDRGRKYREYEAAGVPEYLMVDRRRRPGEIAYHRLDGDGHYQPVAPDDHGRYHSLVIPGFWFDPAWFGQEPLPNPMTILRRISPEAWRRLVAEVEAEE